MKLTTAIAKATKATKSQPTVKGQFYYFDYNGQTLRFSRNGQMSENATITCIHTVTGEDKTDVMTDYFDGIYHDNLTQALRFIGAI